jgi:glutathione S-transferase
MTVTMFQFPSAYGLSSLSPFCTKLETYLRLAKVDHEVKNGDPRRTPTRKLPSIRHGDTVMSDSGAIIAWCKKTFGDPLDEKLTPAQRAEGHLLRRMLEEHTYWAILYMRWIDPDGWALQREAIKPILPAPLRPFLPGLIRRGLMKTLDAHGLGRHGADAIYAAGVSDLDACATLLGDRPWALGAEPSSYDATFFAWLWHIVAQPNDNPLTRGAKRHPNLVSYVERTRAALGW